MGTVTAVSVIVIHASCGQALLPMLLGSLLSQTSALMGPGADSEMSLEQDNRVSPGALQASLGHCPTLAILGSVTDLATLNEGNLFEG